MLVRQAPSLCKTYILKSAQIRLSEIKYIKISTVGYNDYEFTVADVLKLLLNNINEIANMTHLEFEKWLLDNLITQDY